MPYWSALYPNSVQNADDFGLLYDYESAFPAATTLCPTGWHIPTEKEWALLNPFQAKTLRNPVYWSQPNNYTNSTLFDSRGAGFYNGKTLNFERLYDYTAYWASGIEMLPGAKTGVGVMLNVNSNNCCGTVGIYHIEKTDAISVRCVMD